ncbi:hypothetical protein [Clostridium ihumii]|uniref:hypothetical protein n=1 Tax=Clostridium ihumii TaxID=1470356 RepID=UPI003D32F57D
MNFVRRISNIIIKSRITIKIVKMMMILIGFMRHYNLLKGLRVYGFMIGVYYLK